MICKFAKKFPSGSETNFRSKILNGIKLTTIRDSDKWKPGTPIEFVEVDENKEGQFTTGICIEACSIMIEPNIKMVTIGAFAGEGYIAKSFRDGEIEEIAKDDGFDSVDDFWIYFNEDFKGQIISWKLDK